jgi:hypothetical protein
MAPLKSSIPLCAFQRSLETFERARILNRCRYSLAEIAAEIGAPLDEFAAWFRAVSDATLARPNETARRLCCPRIGLRRADCLARAAADAAVRAAGLN